MPVKGWTDWECNATNNALKIEAIWQGNPHYLPAIPVGAHNLVVIDADRRPKGPDGVTALLEHCASHHIDLSTTLSIETPSGGRHYYFVTNIPMSNSRGDLPKGVDVRGDGGYVIAAQACLPDRRAYRIMNGSWDTVAALPEALAAFLRPKKADTAPTPDSAPQPRREMDSLNGNYYKESFRDECEKIAATREGEGRQTAINDGAHALGTMDWWGADRDATLAALFDAAVANGYADTPKWRDKAWETINRAYNDGMAKPRPLKHEPLEQRAREQWQKVFASWIEAFRAKQQSVASLIDSIMSPFDYDCKAKGYAIEGFIPLSTITLITGDAGCGKSTLITVMADAISKGETVLGCLVQSSRPVLYLDRENTLPIIQDRLKRLRILPNRVFKYWGAHITGEVPMPGCAAILEWVERTEPKPVVFVDSMVAFMEGNENSAEDVRAFFNPLRHIAHLGAAVIVLHHTGKGESTQHFRGSSDIKGAIDNGFVMRNEGETRLTTVTIQAFKARYTVTDKFALSYQDGEFIAKGVDQAAGMIFAHLLRTNPGISNGAFEKLLCSKGHGRNQARKEIDAAIADGRILTRRGDRNATLLYLPDSIPQTA